MTANLLAHTDLFAAGIARSGAYNRTLTPFGFQTERRSFWEAAGIYDRMSPFRYADQITAPILLVHGMEDSNSGTYPIQSERLFQAVQGNGGTARLVLLPHESHGYLARESVLHVLGEQFGWLERWLGLPAGQEQAAAAELPAVPERRAPCVKCGQLRGPGGPPVARALAPAAKTGRMRGSPSYAPAGARMIPSAQTTREPAADAAGLTTL